MTREEFVETFVVRRLKDDEIVQSFDCGDEDLNDFILNDATKYQKAMLAVTYLVENKATKRIAAFFSLANDRISNAEFPSGNAFKRFKNEHFRAKLMRNYPAVKLCRFGVDESMRQQSIGRIIVNFIKIYFLTDNKTSCRFITVDAYPTATGFYEKNDFVCLKAHQKDNDTDFLYYDLYNAL